MIRTTTTKTQYPMILACCLYKSPLTDDSFHFTVPVGKVRTTYSRLMTPQRVVSAAAHRMREEYSKEYGINPDNESCQLYEARVGNEES